MAVERSAPGGNCSTPTAAVSSSCNARSIAARRIVSSRSLFPDRSVASRSASLLGAHGLIGDGHQFSFSLSFGDYCWLLLHF
jgi:hypothetical protein